MLPQSQKRVKRNSSKVNLLISLVFHGLIAVAVLYFAARSGVLGNKIKSLTVVMEKPAEKPKPPDKPKEQAPKVDVPKQVAKIDVPKETVQAPPPPANAVEAPPAAAPPPADMNGFSFNEGGRQVDTETDPVQLYRRSLESEFRSRWNRPEDGDDHAFEAEVQISVDRSGQISNPVWIKGSGNSRWDDSVRKAIAQTKSIGRAPPTNFPPRVTVVFDVASESSELVQ
jgi:outer membrane biosynthesis protein TonB